MYFSEKFLPKEERYSLMINLDVIKILVADVLNNLINAPEKSS
jgi:hypothetical protein